MWSPRSPCGENQVLRYSTVRYLLHETLHYVSSFLLLVYRYLPLDVQVMSFTSLQVGSVDTVLRRCPPSHRKPAYFPSFAQRHPSLSLSYIIHSAPYNIPQVGTYLGNTRQNVQSESPPSLPLFCQAIQTTIIKQIAMCSDVHYPIPRNRKLLNRVRYCTSFLCRSHEMTKVGTCRYLAWFFFFSSCPFVPYRTVPYLGTESLVYYLLIWKGVWG